MAYTTSKTLLSKITHGDEIGWREFYGTYRALIIYKGMEDYSLQGEDLETLLQDVMLSVFRSSGAFNYDPSLGRFRDWLRKIIDARANDILRVKYRRKHEDALKENFLDAAPSKSALEKQWDYEWYLHVLNQALDELKQRIEPLTYQMFELYALKEMAPAEVAYILRVKKNAVYLAKKRALDMLREIIPEMN